MIRILFVCLGNICRSPMAEAVLRHKVKEAGLARQIVVDSAGTGDWHIGKNPHEGTRRLLDEKRIPWDGITARQVAEDDLRAFDYIVAMDNSNLGNLQAIAERLEEGPGATEANAGALAEAEGNAKEKAEGKSEGKSEEAVHANLPSAKAPQLVRLLDFVPEQRLKEVPDPYYTGNFEETYRLIDAGCDALLERLKLELELE